MSTLRQTKRRAVIGSLAATARRREAARVAAGNSALLVRLAAVRGAYSTSAWAAAAAEQARRGEHDRDGNVEGGILEFTCVRPTRLT